MHVSTDVTVHVVRRIIVNVSVAACSLQQFLSTGTIKLRFGSRGPIPCLHFFKCWSPILLLHSAF